MSEKQQFSEDVCRSDLNKKIALAGSAGVALSGLLSSPVQAQEVTQPTNSPIDYMATETAKVEGMVTPIIAIAVTSVVFLGASMIFKRFIMS